VPKPIKVLEGIGKGGNGALRRNTAILWTNDQHFILLGSTGVYGKSSPVEHLRIYIWRPCRRAPLYRPMLILTCLTGVTDWSSDLIYVSDIHYALSNEPKINTVRLPLSRQRVAQKRSIQHLKNKPR